MYISIQIVLNSIEITYKYYNKSIILFVITRVAQLVERPTYNWEAVGS